MFLRITQTLAVLLLLATSAHAVEFKVADYEVSFRAAYPACRNWEEAIDLQLSYKLGFDGQRVMNDSLLRDEIAQQYPGRTRPGYTDISPDFAEKTRCLRVGPSALHPGLNHYGVIENAEKPAGGGPVPEGRVAICIMHGVIGKEPPPLPCTWVMAKPEDVVRVDIVRRR